MKHQPSDLANVLHRSVETAGESGRSIPIKSDGSFRRQADQGRSTLTLFVRSDLGYYRLKSSDHLDFTHTKRRSL